MEFDVTPEPPDDHREAIEAALGLVAAQDAGARESRWWQAGVEEAVGDPSHDSEWPS